MAAKTSEFLGTGRRKTSVARVRLASGSGKVVVNGRALENYFLTETLRGVVMQPLAVTETAGRFDVQVNVKGGGGRNVDTAGLVDPQADRGPYIIIGLECTAKAYS